jgi:hypothetical protein
MMGLAGAGDATTSSPARASTKRLSQALEEEMLDGEQWERCNFVEPVVQDAIAHASSLKFMGGQADLLRTTVADIGTMGVGIELFFRTSLYLGWLFAVMTVFVLPALVLNFQGHGMTASEKDAFGLAQFSLGNQGLNEENVPTLGGCKAEGGSVDCTGNTVDTLFTTNPAHVANWIACSDVIYSFVFCVFIFALSWKIDVVSKTQDDLNITASDFTVFVRGFPPTATEKDVHDWFNDRYALDREQPEYKYAFGWVIRKLMRCRGPFKWAPGLLERSAHLTAPSKITKENEKDDYGGRLFQRWSDRQRVAGVVQDLSHRRKSWTTVQEGTNASGCGVFKGSWIADISMAAPNGQYVRGFMQLQSALLHVRTARGKVLKARKQAIVSQSAEGEAKARSHLGIIEKSLKKKEKALTQTLRDPKFRKAELERLGKFEAAFVTFNNAESYERCVSDFRPSSTMLGRFLMPDSLKVSCRLKKKVAGGSVISVPHHYALKVIPAPDPSDIQWENLDTTPHIRAVRKTISNTVAFILLLATLVIIVAAEVATEKARSAVPGLEMCGSPMKPGNLPAVFHGGYDSTPTGVGVTVGSTIQFDATKDQICNPAGSTGPKKYYLHYSNASYVGAVGTSPWTTAQGNVSQQARAPGGYLSFPNGAANYTVCNSACVSPSAGQPACASAGCVEKAIFGSSREACFTYPETMLSSCYCKSQLDTKIEQLGLLKGAEMLSADPLCSNFVSSFLTAQSLVMFGSVVVVAVNTLLTSVMQKLGRMERLDSVSEEAMSVSTKIFFAQFVNTALIVLVVQAKMPEGQSPPLPGAGILEGEYEEFTSSWYTVVGVAVSLNMLFNIFVPHVGPLAKIWIVHPLKLKILRLSGALSTQSQMNGLYETPHFALEQRYPEILNTIFVTMFYCSGQPILLPFCAMAMFTGYWVDKLMLLKFYRRPPQYSSALAVQMRGLLPWALLMHLGIAVWMYGTSQEAPLGLRPSLITAAVSSVLADGMGNATEYATAIKDFEESLAVYDPLTSLGPGKGLIPKIMKTNVLPIFVEMLLLLTGLLIHNTIGLWPFYATVHSVYRGVRFTLVTLIFSVWKSLKKISVVLGITQFSAWVMRKIASKRPKIQPVQLTGRRESDANSVIFNVQELTDEASKAKLPATRGSADADAAGTGQVEAKERKVAVEPSALGGDRSGSADADAAGPIKPVEMKKKHSIFVSAFGESYVEGLVGAVLEGHVQKRTVHDIVQRRRQFTSSFTGDYFQPLNVFQAETAAHRLMSRLNAAVDKATPAQLMMLVLGTSTITVTVVSVAGLAIGLIALAGLIGASVLACCYALLFIVKDNDLAKYAGKSNDLKKAQKEMGFKLEGTGAGADMYRVWLEDDFRYGLHFRSGQKLTTWQAMDGNHSYHIKGNERYTLPFSTFEGYVSGISSGALFVAENTEAALKHTNGKGPPASEDAPRASASAGTAREVEEAAAAKTPAEEERLGLGVDGIIAAAKAAAEEERLGLGVDEITAL